MDKKIVYKNKSISYSLSGEGKNVVLLHGVPEDGSMWQKQVAALSHQWQIITIDFPGSGRSELIENLEIDDMAEVVKNVLDYEGVNEAVIIGHSMGGYVAVAFAEKFPGMLKGLGFFHSSVFADNEEKKAGRKKNIAFIEKHGSWEFIKQSMPGLFSEAFRKSFTGVVDGIIEKYKYLSKETLATYQRAMMDRKDRRKVLEQIVKPVLFIIGEHDKVIPFEVSMEQCHIPALSYIHILKQSGHMGMLEEVEKSNEILESFLKDIL